MRHGPRLSVVLPVHDASAHLHAAVASVLGQTFGDFELILVDDHSSDGSGDILREYERADPRVRLVALERQVGVARALNCGLARVSAPLVARMDADDVARPERFAVQVAEMDSHPDLGLLGAQIHVVGHDGAPDEQFAWVLPLTHDETVWSLVFGTPLCHPTVVMRTDVVRDLGGYDAHFLNEDMELWTRMAFVTRMRNLDAVLLDYRMPTQVHTAKLAAWQPHIRRVGQRYLERILGHPISEAVMFAVHRVAATGEPDDALATLDRLVAPSLLVRSFERMQVLGIFVGDGLESVSTHLVAETQELAAWAHARTSDRIRAFE